MLVSAVQWSESAVCVHRSPPLGPPSHHRPSHSARSSQSTELSSLCHTAGPHCPFTHGSVFTSNLISQFILPSSPLLDVHTPFLYWTILHPRQQGMKLPVSPHLHQHLLLPDVFILAFYSSGNLLISWLFRFSDKQTPRWSDGCWTLPPRGKRLNFAVASLETTASGINWSSTKYR